MNTKLAIFDVDGTLFEGNLGIEFLKVLVAKQMFPQEISEQIFAWYSKYKNGEVEKAQAVDEIYKLYATGMKGLNTDVVKEAAVFTWESVKDKTFPFAFDTIKLLQTNGFGVVLLSGGPTEMISLLGDALGIENNYVLAGKLEVKEKVYTGKILSYPGSAEQKETELQSFLDVRQMDVDWDNSVAMGDNERDLNILRKVGLSLAFEPNDKLLEIANDESWQVIDRDGVMNAIASLINKNNTLS